MTKAEAIQEFKDYIMPAIIEQEKEWGNGKDSIFRSEEWSNFTDYLCKDGRITSYQYNTWRCPAICD